MFCRCEERRFLPPQRLAYFWKTDRRSKRKLRMKKILVYSRSARFRALVAGLLSGRGTEICRAGCVGELVDRCRCGTFDSVVVDDVRLFMDGVDSVSRIRRSRFAGPRIFVMSADLTEDTVMALLGAGIDQYVSLPVDPTRLLDKLCGRRAGRDHD